MKNKPGAIGLLWWGREINLDTGRNRKTKAELRRADTPLEVLLVSAVHELNSMFKDEGYRPGSDRLALIAVALANIKKDTNRSLASSFGVGDPPALSSIRFNTLIRIDSRRKLILPLVRSIKIVEGSADVKNLVNDLYCWSSDVRSNWCFDYYGAPSTKPKDEEKETTE